MRSHLGFHVVRLVLAPAHVPSTVVLAVGDPQILLKLIMYDIAIYIIQCTRPSLNIPASEVFFDPHVGTVPRAALVAFFMLCSDIVMYTAIDCRCHASCRDAHQPCAHRQPARDKSALGPLHTLG